MTPFNGLVDESRWDNNTPFVVQLTADQVMPVEPLKIETVLIKQIHCAVIVLFFLLQAKKVQGERLSFRVVDHCFVESPVKCLAVERRGILSHSIMGYPLRVSASTF